MSIQNECFTVSMQIGVWTGHKLDKAVTDKVTSEAGADADAGRFNKHIIPRTSFAKITTCVSMLRGHLYANTLPWKDNGDRLVTRKLFQKFMDDHATLRDNFRGEVREFIETQYPLAREIAEFRMGNLFNDDDYPTADQLKRKFYCTLDIDEVAQAKDFRLQTDETAIQKRITRAMDGLWEKLLKPLENYAERMSDAEGKFREATVNNLREIVGILPALNFMDDPDLTALGERIKKNLAGFEPKELRENKAVRAGAAAEAEDILRSMRGFMNVMGGQSDEA